MPSLFSVKVKYADCEEDLNNCYLAGILNGVRVGFTFACLKFLAVGDALTIILTEPIWTLFLSKVFLLSFINRSGA